MIGKTVKVIIDRPLGSYHPKHKDIYYSVNYGYIPGIISGDGEEQDAYVLGVNEPLDEFVGKVIAIIHRFNDIEEKWVVAPVNLTLTKEEIEKQVNFQEKYFETEIRMNEDIQGKCGFNCEACPTYIIGNCRGCMLEHKTSDCYTRDCVLSKGIRFCGHCSKFPCDEIINKPHSTILDKDWLLWKKNSHTNR